MMRVIIVGGGIMGLTTAWALRAAGATVTLLDQGPLPNPAGSSVDDHRLIRYPYGERRGFARMVGDAYAAWADLWHDLGETHYVETGTLVLGGPDDAKTAASVATLETIGLRVGPDIEWLTADALARDYPLLGAGAIARGGYRLQSGGILRCGRIVQTLARYLAFTGTDIRPETRVAAVDAAAGSVTLSDGSRLTGDAVIVAAGAWVTKLLPDLATRVVPSRQMVVYLAPPAETAAQWRRMPMLLNAGAEDAGFYLVPPVPGTGLKVGDHRFSRLGDPDAPRTWTPEEARAIVGRCQGYLRDLDAYRIVEPKICYYTVEPDEAFIFHRQDRLLTVSACSGHGFKFGPIIGRAAADLILGRRNLADTAHWARGE